ncbi:MAG TPA: hypothetical protein VFG66_12325 [Gemmatimonadales bacterium]|nr:hypothetical protein [Gemmatimonadales bacterium]
MPLLRTAAPRAIAGGILLLVSLTGCGGDQGPRIPARLSVAEGNGQIGRVGTELRQPIVATVLDADGHPAGRVRVEWQSEGDDVLLPDAAETDERGQARARWRLGAHEGERMARATLPGAEPAVFTAIAEPADVLPLGEFLPLEFETYDGSRQVVHPDYVATPPGVFGQRFHLAITPYPFGNAAYENPSFFEGGRRDLWSLRPGAPNPVVLPDAGYLSDPDLVYVPDGGELWLYYRQVTADNVIRLVRTRDGIAWSEPVEVARAPNHQIISPSVVRRAAGDWWMFAVNAGSSGCGAKATTVEVRRSMDGVHWGDPAPATLAQPGLWAWHIDVQWIPERNAFWAVYNVKTQGSCTTPAIYMAESGDGREWDVIQQPVLVKGVIPELQDIVYRTTFEYDPASDALTFWYSGARYEGGQYRWAAAIERRLRSEVFQSAAATLDPRQLPPAPAPLDEWP